MNRPDSIKTLSKIAQILQKSHPNENPLAHIVQMVREQTNVDVCSLYLLQNKTLVLIASDGLLPSSIGHVRMKIDEGLTGLAIEKLQPVIVNEASEHPRFKYFPETGEEKFHSFAAVPLLDREKVVGALTLQTITPRNFTPHEIEVLKLIAFQLAGVIHNLVTLEILQVEETSHGKSNHFKGIPVAPGFGIGPALFLKSGNSAFVPSRSSEKIQPTKEWEKLKKALKEAIKELKQLEKKLRKRFSKAETDIFSSHRMILADKSFLKKLKTEIEKGKSAADATHSVFGEYITAFQKIENAHFREKTADLLDLRERILNHLMEKKTRKNQGDWEGVLVSETLAPSDTSQLNPERIVGIITEKCGATSHAAILARSLGIPAVMGISEIAKQINTGDLVIVDGNSGEVHLNPDRATLQRYEKIQENYADQLVHVQQYASEAARTRDGKIIRIEANIGFMNDLKKIRYFGAEGVGLYRTEFPFMHRKHLPSEEEQFEHYQEILKEAGELPVTFRILDAGGDKPLQSLNLHEEPNPFLGYRSIRLSLSKPEILRTQFKALLRASVLGKMRVLVPMISGLEELRAVKKIWVDCQEQLKKEGIPYASSIPFGIMIEVPSAVQLVHLLAKEADFLSVGTNDLIQYTLAVDRNNEKVAAFFEPLHPAVLASLHQIIQAAHAAQKPVGICGEVAGDPQLVPLLIGLGIDQLSMIPSNIPVIKNLIRTLSYQKTQETVQKILEAGTIQEVKEIISGQW